jgi:hypothetical protein
MVCEKPKHLSVGGNMEHATAKQLWKLNDLALKCQGTKPRVSLKRGALTVNLPMSKKEASLQIQTLMLKLAEQEAKL